MNQSLLIEKEIEFPSTSASNPSPQKIQLIQKEFAQQQINQNQQNNQKMQIDSQQEASKVLVSKKRKFPQPKENPENGDKDYKLVCLYRSNLCQCQFQQCKQNLNEMFKSLVKTDFKQNINSNPIPLLDALMFGQGQKLNYQDFNVQNYEKKHLSQDNFQKRVYDQFVTSAASQIKILIFLIEKLTVDDFGNQQMDQLLDLFIVVYLTCCKQIQLIFQDDLDKIFELLKQDMPQIIDYNEDHLLGDDNRSIKSSRAWRHKICFFQLQQFQECVKQSKEMIVCDYLALCSIEKACGRYFFKENKNVQTTTISCTLHKQIEIGSKNIIDLGRPQKFISFISFLLQLKFRMLNFEDFPQKEKEKQRQDLCTFLFLIIKYCKKQYLCYPLKALAEFYDIQTEERYQAKRLSYGEQKSFKLLKQIQSKEFIVKDFKRFPDEYTGFIQKNDQNELAQPKFQTIIHKTLEILQILLNDRETLESPKKNQHLKDPENKNIEFLVQSLKILNRIKEVFECDEKLFGDTKQIIRLKIKSLSSLSTYVSRLDSKIKQIYYSEIDQIISQKVSSTDKIELLQDILSLQNLISLPRLTKLAFEIIRPYTLIFDNQYFQFTQICEDFQLIGPNFNIDLCSQQKNISKALERWLVRFDKYIKDHFNMEKKKEEQILKLRKSLDNKQVITLFDYLLNILILAKKGEIIGLSLKLSLLQSNNNVQIPYQYKSNELLEALTHIFLQRNLDDKGENEFTDQFFLNIFNQDQLTSMSDIVSAIVKRNLVKQLTQTPQLPTFQNQLEGLLFQNQQNKSFEVLQNQMSIITNTVPYYLLASISKQGFQSESSLFLKLGLLWDTYKYKFLILQKACSQQQKIEAMNLFNQFKNLSNMITNILKVQVCITSSFPQSKIDIHHTNQKKLNLNKRFIINKQKDDELLEFTLNQIGESYSQFDLDSQKQFLVKFQKHCNFCSFPQTHSQCFLPKPNKLQFSQKCQTCQLENTSMVIPAKLLCKMCYSENQHQIFLAKPKRISFQSIDYLTPTQQQQEEKITETDFVSRHNLSQYLEQIKSNIFKIITDCLSLYLNDLEENKEFYFDKDAGCLSLNIKVSNIPSQIISVTTTKILKIVFLMVTHGIELPKEITDRINQIEMRVDELSEYHQLLKFRVSTISKTINTNCSQNI